MKARTTSLLVATMGLGLLIALPETVFAQGDALRIRRIESTNVRTPQYQTNVGSRSGGQREWAEVRTTFDTAPEWITEMTFTYYILLRSRRPERPEEEFTLLRGDVTYVNVPRGRDAISTMYVHPSTIERHGPVERVGVVITMQGRVVGMESNPASSERWWERATPRTGLVMNHDQSPFAFINIDSYQAIKRE